MCCYWDLGFIYYQNISHPILTENGVRYFMRSTRGLLDRWHDMTQQRFCCRNGLRGWYCCLHCQLTLATTSGPHFSLILLLYYQIFDFTLAGWKITNWLCTPLHHSLNIQGSKQDHVICHPEVTCPCTSYQAMGRKNMCPPSLVSVTLDKALLPNLSCDVSQIGRVFEC